MLTMKINYEKNALRRFWTKNLWITEQEHALLRVEPFRFSEVSQQKWTENESEAAKYLPSISTEGQTELLPEAWGRHEVSLPVHPVISSGRERESWPGRLKTSRKCDNQSQITFNHYLKQFCCNLFTNVTFSETLYTYISSNGTLF